MTEILVTAHTDREDKKPKATVLRVDRDSGTIEALQADGTWRSGTMFDRCDVFKLSNAAVMERPQA